MKSQIKPVQLLLALGAVTVLGACSAPSDSPDATIEEGVDVEEVTPEATEDAVPEATEDVSPEDASEEGAVDIEGEALGDETVEEEPAEDGEG